MRVAFERGGEIRTYPLTQLGEYASVHAMTIHKSQGSQFDEVVVVLPSEVSRLLTRELLYTAVTRAKTRVWVVGAEAPVRAAVGRSVQRASGLGERLWQLRDPRTEAANDAIDRDPNLKRAHRAIHRAVEALGEARSFSSGGYRSAPLPAPANLPPSRTIATQPLFHPSTPNTRPVTGPG